MNNAEHIEQQIKNLNVTTGSELDERILSAASDRLVQTQASPGRGITASAGLWRKIMKNKLVKFAAAAVILIVIGLVVYSQYGQIDFVTPAYAIEQTVEAVQNVRSLHAILEQDGKVIDERWIEIGSDGRQNRYRQDIHYREKGIDALIVDNREKVYYSDRIKHEVTIYDPKEQQYQFVGNLQQFFKDMAGDSSINLEKNIRYKGRPAHKIRWLKLNIDCYIDPMTKLPIALGPHDIYYEDIPEGVFDFEIPQGIAVVDTTRGEESEDVRNEKIAMKKFAQGRKALGGKKYTEAEALLNEVVHLEPRMNYGWFWLGKTYFETGNSDEAIECFTRVIDMFRKAKLVSHDGYLARGLAYRAKGLTEKAMKDFAIALPIMIESLRHPDGCRTFDYADDPVKNGEGLTDDQRIHNMIRRLEDVTGMTFDGNEDMTPQQAEQVICAWENWWAENKTSYVQVTP